MSPIDPSIDAIIQATGLSSTSSPDSPDMISFDAKRFRSVYYEKYFFLFRKNLTNSDIPFGELRSLLQTHITDQSGVRLPLQFDTTKRLTASLAKLWASLPVETGSSYESRALLLAETFTNFITYSIGVDTLYGSCVVHVPKSLEISLERIVAESGYVYAAGKAIFVRRTQKATRALFRNNLEEYLKTVQISPDRKIAFLIHSPQLFPIGEYNREVASQLRHGLDDVKISLDKFFFEDIPLYDFRAQLRDDPELAPYLKVVDIEHSRYDPVKTGTDPARSIWLIAEQEVGPVEVRRGPDRYFACFVQEFVNRNQLHLFNERKPGWLSPITLPQTLASAMLNLARPYFRKPPPGELLQILDPFAGTGTVLLEALKLELPAIYHVNDLNPFNETVIIDNLRFFSASEANLKELHRKVESIKEYLKSATEEAIFPSSLAPRPLPADQPRTLLSNAIAQCRREVEQYQQERGNSTSQPVPKLEYARGISSHLFSDSFKRQFANWSLDQRVVFYVTWRALVRNTFALVNDEDEVKVAKQVLAEEFGLFEYEVKTLMRDCYAKVTSALPTGCVQGIGRYSKSGFVHPATFEKALTGPSFSGNISWTSLDANELLVKFRGEGTQLDLIITDPPYGINALDGLESAGRLIKLYSRFMELAVCALRDGGQLLLCLPENTHNGQNIPAYMTRDIVVREILINAAKAGMEMVNPSLDSPYPVEVFRAPFYWESERTLRRAILHFIVRRRYTANNPPL